jgi:hypothetical protein
VLSVSRPRHAEPRGSIVCHECKKCFGNCSTRQRKTERKDVFCTIRSSTGTREQWKEIHRHFSGRSHVVHCIVSYSRYDNLHLADPRYWGKLFSAALTPGLTTCPKYRIKWLDAIVAFFIQARSWVYQTRPQDSRSTNTCKDLTAVIRYSEYIAKSWHASFGLLSTDLRKPTLASAPLAAHIARSTLWAEAAPQVDARINSPLSLPRKT